MLGLKNDLFFIKHNYIIHTLEDILIPEILKAIDEKRYVSSVIFRLKSSEKSMNSERKYRSFPFRYSCLYKQAGVILQGISRLCADSRHTALII